MKKSSNLWKEYYEAKSQSEKEAILKKILPDITSKELEIMRRKMPVPEAEELAEINKSDEPEKEFTELLRELLATDDSTQKEAIYEKIVEQERKLVREELQKEKGGEKDKPEKNNILTQEEISGVLSGKVSVAEILGLSEEEVEVNMARGDEGKLGDD